MLRYNLLIKTPVHFGGILSKSAFLIREEGSSIAYIREKIKKGNPYYYVVEGRRIDGRVEQVILEYIGPIARLKALALEGYYAKEADAKGHASGRKPPQAGADEDASLSFSAKRHGAVTALLWTAQRIGLEQIMDEAFSFRIIKGQKVSRLLLLCMIHRAMKPWRCRAFPLWCKGTSLPAQLAFQPEELDSALFREAMDGISEEEIALSWKLLTQRLPEIFQGHPRPFHLDGPKVCAFFPPWSDHALQKGICMRGRWPQKPHHLLLLYLSVHVLPGSGVPIGWGLHSKGENPPGKSSGSFDDNRDSSGSVCRISPQNGSESGTVRTSTNAGSPSPAIQPPYHPAEHRIRIQAFLCLAAMVLPETLRVFYEREGLALPKTALLELLDEIHAGWIFKGGKAVRQTLEKLDQRQLAIWKIAESIQSTSRQDNALP